MPFASITVRFENAASSVSVNVIGGNAGEHPDEIQKAVWLCHPLKAEDVDRLIQGQSSAERAELRSSHSGVGSKRVKPIERSLPVTS